MAQFSFIPSGETSELAEDIRELFDDLAAHLKQEQRAYSGECHPALDVRETDHSLEIVVDVAGVPADALRVLFRASVVIVAGEKAPHAAGPHQQFHLVEREFGRFARAVRLNGAFNLQTARATLRDGELTIVLPKLDDRRNRPHRIPVTAANPHPAEPSNPRTVEPSNPRPVEPSNPRTVEPSNPRPVEPSNPRTVEPR